MMRGLQTTYALIICLPVGRLPRTGGSLVEHRAVTREVVSYSKRVGHEIPGVVAVLSCQYLEDHKFISHR